MLAYETVHLLAATKEKVEAEQTAKWLGYLMVFAMETLLVALSENMSESRLADKLA